MVNRNTEYYVSQKRKLLKGFDKTSKRAMKYLSKYYGEVFAETVLKETRGKFEHIIPEIPYIGGG
jgi:hypothetical protein